MTRAAIAAAPPAQRGTNGYFERSSRPLASLLILLPALILYELGTRYYTTAALHGREQQVIAFTELRQFLRMFGATGRYLPALAIVASLLAWHIARNDEWKVTAGTLLGMIAESILLALPLFCLGFLLARFFPLMGATGSYHLSSHTRDMVVMSLGAGIYEEFIFRLALFSLVSLLLKDFMRLHAGLSYVLMVLGSAIMFAAYHYLDPTQHFDPHIFVFRMLAGIYFGIVFLVRGFGVNSFCHISYDVIFSFVQSI